MRRSNSFFQRDKDGTVPNYLEGIKLGADPFFVGVLCWTMKGDPAATSCQLSGNAMREFVDGYAVADRFGADDVHGPSLAQAHRLVFK